MRKVSLEMKNGEDGWMDGQRIEELVVKVVGSKALLQ
jgi:hypothetical protein